MRRAAAALAAGLAVAGCGHSTSAKPVAHPARVLATLIRIGRVQATRDIVVVRADGSADVRLGHGGGGQVGETFRIAPAAYARIRRALARSDLVHPGPPGRDPGIHGGSIYRYAVVTGGHRLLVTMRAEPHGVRGLIRALDPLADGQDRGGPVHRLRTGPAPNVNP